MRRVTSEMEQHEAQPVPPAGQPFAEQEAAEKASTEAWAAETSNEGPGTTKDRSADSRGLEERDETLLRAHTIEPAG